MSRVFGVNVYCMGVGRVEGRVVGCTLDYSVVSCRVDGRVVC